MEVMTVAFTTVNNYGHSHTHSFRDNEDAVVSIVDVNGQLRLEARVYYQNPNMPEARPSKTAVVFENPQEALNFAAQVAAAAQDFANGSVQAAPKTPTVLPQATVKVQGLTPKGQTRRSTRKAS
jgi:hypothetical protein